VVVPVNHRAPARNSPIQKVQENRPGKKIPEEILAIHARSLIHVTMNAALTVAHALLLSLRTAKENPSVLLLHEAVIAIRIAEAVPLRILQKEVMDLSVPSQTKTKRAVAAHQVDLFRGTAIAARIAKAVHLRILQEEKIGQSVPSPIKTKKVDATPIAETAHLHIRQSGMIDQSVPSQIKMKRVDVTPIAETAHLHIRQSGMIDQNALSQIKTKRAIAETVHLHILQSGMTDQSVPSQTKMKRARADLRITTLQNIHDLLQHPAADDSLWTMQKEIAQSPERILKNHLAEQANRKVPPSLEVTRMNVLSSEPAKLLRTTILAKNNIL
jgi:hypothetical protein